MAEGPALARKRDEPVPMTSMQWNPQKTFARMPHSRKDRSSFSTNQGTRRSVPVAAPGTFQMAATHIKNRLQISRTYVATLSQTVRSGSSGMKAKLLDAVSSGGGGQDAGRLVHESRLPRRWARCPSNCLSIDFERKNLCGMWKVRLDRNVRVFGSVARVKLKRIAISIPRWTSSPDAVAGCRRSLVDLEVLLGRKVDLLTAGGVNRHLRETILTEARPL